MNKDLKGVYFVKKNENDTWEDITTKFDGVRVLSIEGFLSKGKPINIYNEQWINSQDEDFGIGSDEVIYENEDITITFICGDKYAVNAIDVRKQHDAFVDYLTNGELYIKSSYADKSVRCACKEAYNPTTIKLKRGINNSWVLGTIKLHKLSAAEDTSEEHSGDVYLGFGGSSLTSMTQIQNLTNLQHYDKDDASGNYSIMANGISYLWICVSGTISEVTSSGFEVPMESARVVGDLRCYRTSNSIARGLMNIKVATS